LSNDGPHQVDGGKISQRREKILGFSALGAGLVIMAVGSFLWVVGLLWYTSGSSGAASDEGPVPNDACFLIIGIIFIATASLCLIIFKEKREKWLKDNTDNCWRCGEPLEPEERFCFICGEEREDQVKVEEDEKED